MTTRTKRRRRGRPPKPLEETIRETMKARVVPWLREMTARGAGTAFQLTDLRALLRGAGKAFLGPVIEARLAQEGKITIDRAAGLGYVDVGRLGAPERTGK